MPSQTRIRLVPWDPDSSEHIERLVEQRVQCGWDADRVDPKWRDEQRAGVKCLYWILLSPDEPETDERLKLHWTMYPKETQALKDTGAAVRGAPRSPSQAAIHPVGHISLDAANVEAKGLDLDLPPSDVYWIKTFYVSKALQGAGLGRAAMDLVESMAVDEPLCARTLALDTVHKDDSTHKITNQEWYGRRGYRLIKTVPDFYEPGLRTAFMRRDLT